MSHLFIITHTAAGTVIRPGSVGAAILILAAALLVGVVFAVIAKDAAEREDVERAQEHERAMLFARIGLSQSGEHPIPDPLARLAPIDRSDTHTDTHTDARAHIHVLGDGRERRSELARRLRHQQTVRNLHARAVREGVTADDEDDADLAQFIG